MAEKETTEIAVAAQNKEAANSDSPLSPLGAIAASSSSPVTVAVVNAAAAPAIQLPIEGHKLLKNLNAKMGENIHPEALMQRFERDIEKVMAWLEAEVKKL